MDQGSRPALRDSLRSVLLTFAVAWLWVSAMVIIFGGILGLRPGVITGLLSVSPDRVMSLPVVGSWMHGHPAFSIFAALVLAPFLEEGLFRVLPLSYALVKEAALVEKGNKKRGRNFVRAVAIVVCGLIFGIAHGSPINIFVQGAVGILCARLYLRNHEVSQHRAYLMCVGVHFLYNFAVIAAMMFG